MKIHGKKFGKVVAILYILGITLNAFRIIIGFEPSSIPPVFDVIILVGALYGGVSYLKYWKEIYFPRKIMRVLYGAITFHLLGSVVVHFFILIIPNNKILNIFPVWYSYIIIVIMALFAYYSWNVQFKEPRNMQYTRMYVPKNKNLK